MLVSIKYFVKTYDEFAEAVMSFMNFFDHSDSETPWKELAFADMAGDKDGGLVFESFEHDFVASFLGSVHGDGPGGKLVSVDLGTI